MNASDNDSHDLAVVIGSNGGIGSAFVRALSTGGDEHVVSLSRHTAPPIDLTCESSIESAAKTLERDGRPVRLVIDATGVLTIGGRGPEKSLRDIDPERMAQAFAVNAIGPALLLKHFLPILPRTGRAVFATLSARVGSIEDNRLGGWIAYRASKAALNQIVRTAAVELRRRQPEAICVALHPGTVETRLSHGFARAGLDVQTPEQAATNLLGVIAKLRREDSGGFFDWKGAAVPW